MNSVEKRLIDNRRKKSISLYFMDTIYTCNKQTLKGRWLRFNLKGEVSRVFRFRLGLGVHLSW